jgi:hypothetical protein
LLAYAHTMARGRVPAWLAAVVTGSHEHPAPLPTALLARVRARTRAPEPKVQLMLRLPPRLRQRLRRVCMRGKRTMEAYIAEALRERLGRWRRAVDPARGIAGARRPTVRAARPAISRGRARGFRVGGDLRRRHQAREHPAELLEEGTMHPEHPYRLVIHAPGGAHDVLTSFWSPTPFSPIHVGDRLTPESWRKDKLRKPLRVASVEHLLLQSAGVVTRHTIIVCTEAGPDMREIT